MRWLWILLPLLILASCGRPLTPAEKSFATQIHGDSLDVTRVRFRNGALIGETTYQRQKRPRLTCRERILPEPESDLVTVSPAAFVLHNDVSLPADGVVVFCGSRVDGQQRVLLVLFLLLLLLVVVVVVFLVVVCAKDR